MMTASAPTPPVFCRTAATGSVLLPFRHWCLSFRRNEFLGIEVEPDHLTAIGLQQLGRQQTDQTQSDHHHCFSEVGAARRMPCRAMAPIR